MQQFTFSVSNEIFSEFPKAKIAGVVVRNLKAKENNGDLLKTFQSNVLSYLDKRGENIFKEKEITSWQKFFATKIGPDKEAAHVALLNRVFKKKAFPQINQLVDIYNTFSVYKQLPIGGHDLNNRSNIKVARTKGDEEFKVMNSDEIEKVQKGEYAYQDDLNHILTRHLVWRQSDYSKITDITTDFFVPLDDLFDIFSRKELMNFAELFAGILHNFYSFEYQLILVDKYNPSVSIRDGEFNDLDMPIKFPEGMFASDGENFSTEIKKITLPEILQKKITVNTDKDILNKFFDHKIDQIYPTTEELRRRLESGERLKFYIGADATGPNLHIGHLIPILKLKELQSMGHEIIFLVGDFTARLGDPTDKSETRRILSEDEVKSNASQFQMQIARYIDFDTLDNPAKIVFNSTWSEELSLSDVIQLASHTTVQQMLERDMFEDRINNKKPIFLHEFLYPLIQGYDSVALNVDGEFGGRDQTFNMLMGRTLMKAYKNKDKFVLTTHFLLSADGVNKMSKSIGNCIFINDSAETKYAKVMSIPDDLIIHYYQLATNRTLEDIKQIENRLKTENDPMKIKKELAFEIVTIHDGEEGAKKADQFFTDTVQNNETPENAEQKLRSDLLKILQDADENGINPIHVVEGGEGSYLLIDLLKVISDKFSNSELKRLIRDGAVEINGRMETSIGKVYDIKEVNDIRIGKKMWIKFID